MFTDIDTSVVDTLLDNPKDIMTGAAEILIKLLCNVIREPNNIKYRSIRLGNPKIESKLLVANGAFEILFTVGFEEGTDSLILPMSASIPMITAFKSAIEKLVETGSKNTIASASTSEGFVAANLNRQINAPSFSSNSNTLVALQG